MPRCKVCRTEYKKWRMTQKVCGSVECAAEYARQVREKEERKELRAAKQKAKRRGDWLKDTERVCNEYIRIRDDGKPCISCGQYRKLQAGHFIAVGRSQALRYCETNINGQCQQCNTYLRGNLLYYRAAMVEMHGEEFVRRLESFRDKANWRKDELIEIIEYYKAKTAELIRNRKMAA